MNFQIKANLTNDVKPVIKTVVGIKIFTCKEFKGQLSSVTGIISKFLYISKINQFTCATETPTVKIICSEECKDKCKYL